MDDQDGNGVAGRDGRASDEEHLILDEQVHVGDVLAEEFLLRGSGGRPRPFPEPA